MTRDPQRGLTAPSAQRAHRLLAEALGSSPESTGRNRQISAGPWALLLSTRHMKVGNRRPRTKAEAEGAFLPGLGRGPCWGPVTLLIVPGILQGRSGVKGKSKGQSSQPGPATGDQGPLSGTHLGCPGFPALLRGTSFFPSLCVNPRISLGPHATWLSGWEK